jgi:hypothetical protein
VGATISGVQTIATRLRLSFTFGSFKDLQLGTSFVVSDRELRLL